MVRKFSLNWEPSSITDTDDSLIKFEHEFEEHCPDLAIVLSELSHNINAHPASSITINIEPLSKKVSIGGTTDDVMRFIGSFQEELSPIQYQPVIAVQSFPSLEQLCAKKIARSYYHPQFFSLMNTLPLRSQSAIETVAWNHLEVSSDVEPYAGKIILFKTDSHRFSGGHLINPEQENIKIGIIDENPLHHDPSNYGAESERSYGIWMGSQANWGCALITSEIQYSNFYVRLPTLEELKIIYDIYSKNATSKVSIYLDLMDLAGQQMQELQTQFLSIESSQSTM